MEKNLVKINKLMNEVFQFKIGDLVISKAQKAIALDNPKKRDYQNDPQPQVFEVVERLMQQCHGGVQRHLQLRPSGIDHIENLVSGKLFQLTEPEVEAHKAKPTKPVKP